MPTGPVGGGPFADEILQYNARYKRGEAGDRGAADAADAAAFKKLQGKMAGGGTAVGRTDTVASSSNGIPSSIGAETRLGPPSKPAAPEKPPAPPPAPKAEKKNCLAKVGDFIGKVAGFAAAVIPAVGAVANLFRGFGSGTKSGISTTADTYEKDQEKKKAAGGDKEPILYAGPDEPSTNNLA